MVRTVFSMLAGQGPGGQLVHCANSRYYLKNELCKIQQRSCIHDYSQHTSPGDGVSSGDNESLWYTTRKELFLGGHGMLTVSTDCISEYFYYFFFLVVPVEGGFNCQKGI